MAKVNYRINRQPCGLHECLRPIMQLCRWAGFFPVRGLGQLKVEDVKCKFKSIYSIYHIVTFIGQAITTCFSLMRFFDGDIVLRCVANLVFYVTGLISATLFIKLAQQWPMLMKKAQETEQCLNKLTNSPVKKCKAISYIIMSLQLVVHLLCSGFIIKYVMVNLNETYLTNNVIEHYVKNRMPHVFNYISYNIFYAILAEISCLQAILMWSFTDVIAICFSIYITSYLQNLNKMIDSKKNSKTSWGSLREQYSKIAILVKEIDSQLSSFILLSFFNDLFFIWLQLFQSLHPNVTYSMYYDEEERNILSPDYPLYYTVSFLFLLGRSLLFSFFVANVYATAQESVVALYDVPSLEYDMELNRFQLQLRFTPIGLSGKLFIVTRNVVLQVISLIITYELVLLQFSKVPSAKYNHSFDAVNFTSNKHNVSSLYAYSKIIEACLFLSLC